MNPIQKTLIPLLPALTLVMVCALPVFAGRLAPEIERQLSSGAATCDVIVTLADNVPDEELVRVAQKAAAEAPRQRRRQVVETLKTRAERAQVGVRELIRRLERDGQVKRVRHFWIFNGISLSASPAAIRELAKRDDVAEIVPDAVRPLSLPEPQPAAVAGWNLDRINAKPLWDHGFTGQGVLVATLDTGVDATHPEVSGSWRGGTNSWFDPWRSTSVPYDVAAGDTSFPGHGTAVMSLVVGRTVGVAPGARWISAKIFADPTVNPTLTAQDSAVHAAFQWALNPDGNSGTTDAPDIVNNSWALDAGYNEIFRSNIQKLRLAGIAVVAAAGNYGSASGTSASPGNYPETFAVGATESSDSVAYFSSRGPTAAPATAFTSADMTFDPTYPQVCAPGQGVPVAILGGGYSFASGTSFSAPQVAGAMALLKSAIPGVTVEQMETALKQSVVAASGPENDCGYGRIDVAKAFSYLSVPGDVTGDGEVKVNDVVVVLKAVVNPALADGLVLHNGDAFPVGHPDGRITIEDALLILRKTVGLPSF